LAPKRMVVIRDLISTSKKTTDAAWDALAKTPDWTIVVLWETQDTKELEKKPLYKTLKAGADVHLYPFPVIEGSALIRWTADRVKSAGAAIAPDALNLLVQMVGSDLWQMHNEIEKLAARSTGGMITTVQVRELVHASFEEQIFDLVDAVSQRRTVDALRLLDEQRQAGAADGYILSMLMRQARILLSVRALLQENPRATKELLASELGLHPFVAGKALSQARGFTLDSLTATHDLLYKLDLGMKTSRYDDTLAADLAVNALLT